MSYGILVCIHCINHNKWFWFTSDCLPLNYISLIQCWIFNSFWAGLLLFKQWWMNHTNMEFFSSLSTSASWCRIYKNVPISALNAALFIPVLTHTPQCISAPECIIIKFKWSWLMLECETLSFSWTSLFISCRWIIKWSNDHYQFILHKEACNHMHVAGCVCVCVTEREGERVRHVGWMSISNVQVCVQLSECSSGVHLYSYLHFQS